MKYLAMLKDSFREAIDTKVLYVMLGLSCLITLVIGSISFIPMPPKEALNEIVRGFYVVYGNRGESLEAGLFNVNYTLDDLKQLNEAAEPQAGDYGFILSMPEERFREAAAFWNHGSTDEEAKEQRPTSLPDSVLGAFIAKQFSMVGNIEVAHTERVKAPAADKIAFLVETKGSQGVRGWLHEPCLVFGALPLKIFRQSVGSSVYLIEDLLINGLGAWITILIAIVITSFFIPNMLRKGTVDLLLVKPIHRTTLLIYKYVGGLTFMFLTSAVAILGVWLAIGMRSGIWAPGFLLSIFVFTFFFAILYSVSALFGVLTRSPIVAILMTCLVWFLLWAVGSGYTGLEAIHKDDRLSKQLPVPEWIYSTVETIHYVLPRTKDLDLLTDKLLSRGVLTQSELRLHKLDRLPPLTWGESFTVSGIFIGLMLGFACWRFAIKDY